MIDAGPVVALIDWIDPHHRDCGEALAGIADPPGTVWPVLTAAMYLLRLRTSERELWGMLGVAEIQLMIELGSDDCARMRGLMWKYHDLPLDLADAALVRMAECERVRRVFRVSG